MSLVTLTHLQSLSTLYHPMFKSAFQTNILLRHGLNFIWVQIQEKPVFGPQPVAMAPIATQSKPFPGVLRAQLFPEATPTQMNSG